MVIARMVREAGFEPTSLEPRSSALPLSDSRPMECRSMLSSRFMRAPIVLGAASGNGGGLAWSRTTPPKGAALQAARRNRRLCLPVVAPQGFEP